MSDFERARVGFIGFFAAERQGLLGAAMVTDERGYPLEFRLSETVRLSAFQRAAYGKTREPYLIQEVIGGPLVDAIETSVDVLVTNRHEAFEMPSPYPLLYAKLRGPRGGGELDASGSPVQVAKHLLAIVKRIEPADVFERMEKAAQALAKGKS